MNIVTEPTTRSKQPARADQRRLPPAELTRSGPCGPRPSRPGHAPSRPRPSAPLPGLLRARVRPACGRSRSFVTRAPSPPIITSGSWVLRVEMLTPGRAEALTLGVARRADRKSPTPVARRSAGMLCGLPSHQAWNPKSAPLRDDDWGFGLPPPVRIQGDAPDHGSSTGATRQVEIDQSFYGLEIRRVSDTSRLSDTAANHLAGARQRDRQAD